MVANRIDGKADAEEPERESLVVVEEDGGLAEEKEKSGGERGRSEVVVGEPLVSRPSIGIEPLIESVVTPQIPRGQRVKGPEKRRRREGREMSLKR